MYETASGAAPTVIPIRCQRCRPSSPNSMCSDFVFAPPVRRTYVSMDEYDGRPHWGKRHYQSAATLRPRYPEWDRFLEIRERFDPQRRFENDYLRRVLG